MEQFGHDEQLAIVDSGVEDGKDIRMRQRRYHLCFPLESRRAGRDPTQRSAAAL